MVKKVFQEVPLFSAAHLSLLYVRIPNCLNCWLARLGPTRRCYLCILPEAWLMFSQRIIKESQEIVFRVCA